MDTDSYRSYEDPAVFFKWKCEFFKKYAKDRLKLEGQFLSSSVVALFDSDYSIGIRCDNFAASFHVKCCMDSLKMREYKAYEINKWGPFTCCGVGCA